MEGKVTAPKIIAAKGGEKIAVLTAYDYPMAKLLDKAGIDIVLVGDSLSNVVLGYKNTVPVTMNEMIHHASAVARGVERALVIGDMPFMSYQPSNATAVKNAGRFLKEAKCQAVKIEGGKEMAARVKAIVDSGIPVMGHLGLTPQSENKLGGYKVQGRGEKAAEKMVNDALALEKAGCFSIVLECVPSALAKTITQTIGIPTIGIGAGIDCDGQVLVVNDLLGLGAERQLKFVKQYASLDKEILGALGNYVKDVREKKFPGKEHSFE